MSVIVKESTMVCPANNTPTNSIWLSSIDLTRLSLYSHFPMIFIYSPNSNDKKGTPFATEILKDTLSKVLVPFYPLAGRLSKNKETGRIEINCNGEGVLFVEAEANPDIVADDLIKNSELRRSYVPSCDYSGGISSFPVMMIQLTRFKCGSVSIGFAVHHYVADGIGYTYFYTSWARLTRGVGLRVQPVHERRPYLSPRDPPRVKFEHLEFEPPLPPIKPMGYSGETTTVKECLFELSKHQINELISQVKSQSKEAKNYKLSAYEVLAAHVWRSACKARGLTGDQYVKLYMPVEGRSILKDPTLPKGFCGNIIFFAACKAKASDITCKPLRNVVNKVQEQLEKFKNSEYLRSSMDYMESQPDLTPFARGAHSATCPNLSLNSWTKIPFDEGDYGWGKPKFVGLGRKGNEGQAFFISSLESDSILLSIALYSVHMPLFEKYLYDFDSLSTMSEYTDGSTSSPAILSKI